MITNYAGISPKGDLILLGLLGEKLKGRSFLHINSTKEGGGVAEILHRMVPIMADLGVEVRWETIKGDGPFFDITKRIHNALQGNPETVTEMMWRHHFEVNRRNAETIDLDADMVLIHDPQPAPLIEFRKCGRWAWRCHIDVSGPVREVSSRLFQHCEKFDAAVFSVARFAEPMGIDEFIVPPSVDPLSEKTLICPTVKSVASWSSSTFLWTGLWFSRFPVLTGSKILSVSSRPSEWREGTTTAFLSSRGVPRPMTPKENWY
jgi:trehalose synthase